MTRAAIVVAALLCAPLPATSSPDPLCSAVLEFDHAGDADTAFVVCLDVSAAAELYGLDPRLAVAVAWVESRLSAGAVSHCDAVGPMQVISRLHCEQVPCRYVEGIDAGVRLIVRLLVSQGSARAALAAYNCGVRGARLRPDACAGYADRVLEIARALGWSE